MAISDDGMSSTESVGFFSQIGDSIKGILIGMVLLPASIYTVFKVETCTQAGAAFKNAKPVAQMEQGKPIYVTGKLTADPIGSRFVQPGKYIRISQDSQVYAWDEEEKTEGSGSNKKKIKECKLEWTTNPRNPSSFSLPGCKNKPFHKKLFQNETVVAQDGAVNADGKTYKVNLKDVNFTSAVPTRDPDDANIILNGFTKSDRYLFEKKECASSPIEGCERVNIDVTPIPEADMTFLGSLSGSSIVPYVFKDDKFLNASVGTYEQTLTDIKNDDSTMKWIGRGLAFLMMWAAFSMMAGPLTTLLEFIPFVGEFGSGAIHFVLGAVAFVITAITIILVKFWFIWLAILIGGIGFAYYKRKQKATA
ncbi:MAG: TMEM43 family protein [Leptospiraceae bacterium]|nr:TMEM43 family protein [Leptospiraceae bacterium]